MRDHNEDSDLELTTLLSAGLPRAPVDDVDWDVLHARITARARPLVRRVPATVWWQLVADWSARGVPIAAAASAVLALAIGTGVVAPRTSTVADTSGAVQATATTSFFTVEEELAYAATESSVLMTDADADEIIDALLFYGRETP